MKSKEKVYVIDTNIIIDGIEQLEQISEKGKNLIVIPETALIELEGRKKSMDEAGFQSREFARLLNNSKEIKTIVRNKKTQNEFSIIKFQTKSGMLIDIISKKYYEANEIDTSISERNDKRIVEIAEVSKQYYIGKKIIFLSLDLYARIFSKFKKIATETLRKNETNERKEKTFQFIKKIPLTSKEFNEINNNQDIKLYDKNHKKENYSYELYDEKITEKIKYAIIVNDKIKLINNDLDFRGMIVKPINIEQKFFAKSILEPQTDMCIVDAPAGSGKTLIALSTAMRLISTKNQFNKIIYVRNSIESLDKGADVGFLSGNDEKFRIYNMALYDNLEFMAIKELTKKNKTEDKITKEEIDFKVIEYKEKYNIQTLWPGESRGRNFTNAIFIFDEWQNSSNNTTQLSISRLHFTCKSIVIGSTNQIDNIYLSPYNNGLTNLLKISNNYEELIFFATKMPKSVRGKFSLFADEVF